MIALLNIVFRYDVFILIISFFILLGLFPLPAKWRKQPAYVVINPHSDKLRRLILKCPSFATGYRPWCMLLRMPFIQGILVRLQCNNSVRFDDVIPIDTHDGDRISLYKQNSELKQCKGVALLFGGAGSNITEAYFDLMVKKLIRNGFDTYVMCPRGMQDGYLKEPQNWADTRDIEAVLFHLNKTYPFKNNNYKEQTPFVIIAYSLGACNTLKYFSEMERSNPDTDALLQRIMTIISISNPLNIEKCVQFLEDSSSITTWLTSKFLHGMYKEMNVTNGSAVLHSDPRLNSSLLDISKLGVRCASELPFVEQGNYQALL